MKKYKKGFTLIELLAVIVILAILIAIVIPSITKYITKSRKDGMIVTAKEFISAIRHDTMSDFYEFPISNDDITIVSTELIKLEKGKKKSSFNGKWLSNYSYVAIINIGTEDDPDYDYYIALRDSNRYTISLSTYDEISRDSIDRISNKNLNSTITSICGSKDGEYMVMDKIIGLEKYQPIDGWNAIVYSLSEC